jgi:hypothetical protein
MKEALNADAVPGRDVIIPLYFQVCLIFNYMGYALLSQEYVSLPAMIKY